MTMAGGATLGYCATGSRVIAAAPMTTMNMAITQTTAVRYTCSDGTTFDDKLDAELHEAKLGLKKVCDEHGYSAPSFSRELLFGLLLENAPAFRVALDAYVRALVAKRTAEATGGKGSLAAAFTEKT